MDELLMSAYHQRGAAEQTAIIYSILNESQADHRKIKKSDSHITGNRESAPHYYPTDAAGTASGMRMIMMLPHH
jgi:hypothetical protein